MGNYTWNSWKKKRYLQEFLERTGLSVEELCDLISTKEDTLHSCYAETIKFDKDAFVEIILVDMAFIVELLLRYSFRELQTREDCIFGKPCLIQDIWNDMWLVENQIPFFILEEIFNLQKVSATISAILKKPKPQFIKLTFKYFKSLEAVNGKLERFKDATNGVEVKHFTDLLRICHLPSEEQTKEQEKKKKSNEESEKKKRKVVTAPSVIQLLNAGAELKLSESKDSFQISFKKGTLEMPPLKLELETESLFRNLIAFEQRHYSSNYINDYVFIIHHLANTPKDIELLVEKQIIEN
ncbi:UPF0481 protein At3g47200-like [Mangifera indica]|uniref:UPF0481 protein At3g47200-like n=1 Tax=Mangifera indica TaxID=29780 RepID=UPI001CFB18CA|nr:UPF0481 protein At3g47200-like [Mangifera indica]